MKKLISILLALAMILALSTTAFAAENTTLTINGSEDSIYNGYKLLNLTTSLKCTDAEHEHDANCYNYAYTVNEKYQDILAAEAGDADIIEFLADLTSDSGSTYGTLREVADRIYRAIQEATLDPDAENLTSTGSSIGQGYWLFADVTDLDDTNAANSLVMVDTKGQDELTITPKVGLPTVEKKVKDVNDTTGAESGWQDSADYDIGDTVPFQLTATLPANVANYESYMISFHDTLSAGLTLDAASIKVWIGETDVTNYFTIPAADFTGTSFEVSCENILAIEGVTKDTVFVVTYNATLNNSAAIGAEGNPNDVYLEFSNNPYGDGTGKTEDDTVIVFTYQLIVDKTDPTGAPLTGAGFTLYKKTPGGEYEELFRQPMMGGTTFTWTGLDDGEYMLEETTVPDGYNKMADIYFTITAEHSETADEPELISLSSTFGTVADGVIKETVVNQTGTILPETGAQGTLMLITFSTVLVMAAVVFMVTRKKMSIYED